MCGGASLVVVGGVMVAGAVVCGGKAPEGSPLLASNVHEAASLDMIELIVTGVDTGVPSTPATPNQTPRTRRRRRRRAVDLDDFKRKGGGTPRSRRRGLSVRFEPSKVGIGAKPRSVSVGPAREDLGGLGDDLVAVGRALRAVADGGRPAPWAELCDEDRAGASRELLAAVKDLYEQLTSGRD